jgi:hypothetical protein
VFAPHGRRMGTLRAGAAALSGGDRLASMTLARSVAVFASLALYAGAIGHGWADEAEERLKIQALLQEGELILDEAHVLQPVSDALEREGSELDAAEQKLHTESATLNEAISAFNARRQELDRAAREQGAECPRQSEDRALVERCNARAMALQASARESEERRIALQAQQRELNGRVEQHNAARRDLAARRRAHEPKAQANRADGEQWLDQARRFFATPAFRAWNRKAGEPPACSATAPEELASGSGTASVERAQRCIKAIAGGLP